MRPVCFDMEESPRHTVKKIKASYNIMYILEFYLEKLHVCIYKYINSKLYICIEVHKSKSNVFT